MTNKKYMSVLVGFPVFLSKCNEFHHCDPVHLILIINLA